LLKRHCRRESRRPVETTQVAPTILKALGLDASKLQAVRIEGTQVLPGVDLSSDSDRE
jgi:arylsulfatase A-like enzyme